MDREDLIKIIVQVLTSWQVIAITIAVLLYIFLVGHVAKSYHRPRTVKKVKEKKKKEAAPVAESDDITPVDDSNDDLGLEEA